MRLQASKARAIQARLCLSMELVHSMRDPKEALTEVVICRSGLSVWRWIRQDFDGLKNKRKAN